MAAVVDDVTHTRAATLATELLAGVATRLDHSRGVAERGGEAFHLLRAPWRTALIDAAWLHDIGYSQAVVVTEFHPLDGARWLTKHGWRSEVCRLVAWHTGAAVEARLRNLDKALRAEFLPPPRRAQAALTWADLTSSPTGESCSVEARLIDILCRYPFDSVVHRAVSSNLRSLREAVEVIQHLLEDVQAPR